MAPNVTISFWAANDINGTPLLTITDEDTYFKGLKLQPDLYSLGGWELTLSRAWGFELFGSGATDAEVFVRFMVHAYSDSTWFYGGVLNKRDLTVVHRQEIGAEDYVIGGTGPKQYMDRSALGIEQRTGLGFNLDLANGVWRWNEAATAGRILDTVVDEDNARSNPSLPDATYNFNATNDSDGNPWTNEVTPGAGEYQTPIGSSLLDVIFDLEDLTELYTTVHLGSLASPQYQLNAFQSFGDDNTGSAFGPGVGLLREGVNIANEALHVQGVGFRKASHVIVEGKDHVWVTEVRPTWSPGDYVKWDKINYSRSSSEAILHRAGLRWLQRQNNGDQQLTVEIVPGNSPNTGYYFPAPNDPIWLGNTISLDTVADGSVHSPLDYENAPQLVTGLELELGEAGDNSTADREAKSWDVKVRLNWERAGHAASPDQQSASTITCRCQGGNHPPPPCIPPVPGTVLSDSTSDPSDWPGTDLTTGTCWSGDHHMSMGASGGSSAQVSVSAGDIITGTITFREETGNDSWENNSNYAYVAYLKLEGAGQPILEYEIVNQLYYRTGCIDVDHDRTVTVPTGYTTARIRFRFRLGGIRYIASISESADAPPDIPFCVDPTLPADSPYSYPSDTVDALIQQEIANAKVGNLRRYMLNNSGGELDPGDLVIPDTATIDAVTTTTSSHQAVSPVGIVTEGGSDGEQVLVTWNGMVAALNTPDTLTAGHYVFTSTVAGEADLSATRGAGAVGQIGVSGGVAVVYLWGVPDSSSAGGAPTTADYLVGTANGSLSAEIVVGTTPGGELGNTWASPTIDTTHAGSNHLQPVRKNSAGTVFTRRQLNLIEGSNVTLTVADDAGNDEVDITIASSGGSYTDEQAQDAVGTILTDTASVDFTYNDGAPSITADVLPAGVNITALGGFPATTTTFLRGDGTFATVSGSAGGTTRVVKTANEIVNNSNTPQADNHLTLSVAASKRYGWKLHLWFDSGTTPDIKFEVRVPTGADGYMSGMGFSVAGASDNEAPVYAYGAGGGWNDGGIAGGVIRHRRMEGYLKTAGTAGSIDLYWSQNTANASDTTLHEGSFMELYEL